MQSLLNRSGPRSVALETTLLAHGLPRDDAMSLLRALEGDIRGAGAEPAVIGVVRGRAIVGMTEAEIAELVDSKPPAAKANTANLGILIHKRENAATTVSATVELAAAAGIRVLATGGIGGVHRNYAERLDISADLGAMARFPVAVVASGVKSLLDVAATREMLETLGIPVIGWKTREFPAFYVRGSDAGMVDAAFDSEREIADFVRAEQIRTGRGALVVNPIPPESALEPSQLAEWLGLAEEKARKGGASGRSVTPATLAALHEVSKGATVRANVALVRANVRLAGAIAAKME